MVSHVGSLHFPESLSSLLKELSQPVFVDFVSPHSVERSIKHISRSDVDAILSRNGDAVVQLLAPALFVGQRFIEQGLTGVHVHEPLELVYPDLSPDVVCPVVDLSCIVTKCNADSSKCICPLSASSGSGFEKFLWVVVSWKPCLDEAVLASVDLHS